MVARPKKRRPQRPRLTHPPRRSVAKDAAMAIVVAAVVVNVAVNVVIAKAVRAAKVALRTAVKAAKVRKRVAKVVTTVARVAPRALSVRTVNVPAAPAVKVKVLALKVARRIPVHRRSKEIPPRFARSVHLVANARVASVAKVVVNAARDAVSVAKAEARVVVKDVVKVVVNAHPVPRTLKQLSPPKSPLPCLRWPPRPPWPPRLHRHRWMCSARKLAQRPRVPNALPAKKVVSVVSAARATAMAEIGVNVANVRRVKVKLRRKPAHRCQQTHLPPPVQRPPLKPALPRVPACRALVSTTCP